MSKQYYVVAKSRGVCPEGVDCEKVVNFFSKKASSVRESEIVHYVFFNYLLKKKQINASIKLFLAFDVIKERLISKNVNVVEDIKELIEKEASILDIYKLGTTITFIPEKHRLTKKAFEILRQKGQINREKTDKEILDKHDRGYNKKTKKDFLILSKGCYNTTLITFYTLVYLSALKEQKRLELRYETTKANIRKTFSSFTDIYINVYLGNRYTLEYNTKKQDYVVRRRELEIEEGLLEQTKKEEIKTILDILDYPNKIEEKSKILDKTKKEEKNINADVLKLLDFRLTQIIEGLSKQKEKKKNINIDVSKFLKRLTQIEKGIEGIKQNKEEEEFPEINLKPLISLSI